MSQNTTWSLPSLAAALGVPDEAFRPFARLRGFAWDTLLPAADAAGLALAWFAADRVAASGPIAEAAGALLDAVSVPAGA
jgi:hypothetical protein